MALYGRLPARRIAAAAIGALVTLSLLQRGGVVRASDEELKQHVGSGDWQVSITPTNQQSSSASPGGAAAALANSVRTTALASVSIAGPTDGSLFAEARASYSGTWTFTWQPLDANDWPSDVKIVSIAHRAYLTRVQNGSGTAVVRITGGADLASASLPNGGTSSNEGPTTTEQVDTTDPNLTVTTRSSAFRSTRGTETTMSDLRGETTTVERAYSAAWFPAHFAAPADIVVNFMVAATDRTARIDFNTSNAEVGGTASILASDVFFVR